MKSLGGLGAREIGLGAIVLLAFGIGWLQLSSFWAVCLAAIVALVSFNRSKDKTDEDRLDDELRREGSHLRLLRPLRLNDLDARDRP